MHRVQTGTIKEKKLEENNIQHLSILEMVNSIEGIRAGNVMSDADILRTKEALRRKPIS